MSTGQGQENVTFLLVLVRQALVILQQRVKKRPVFFYSRESSAGARELDFFSCWMYMPI